MRHLFDADLINFLRTAVRYAITCATTSLPFSGRKKHLYKSIKWLESGRAATTEGRQVSGAGGASEWWSVPDPNFQIQFSSENLFVSFLSLLPHSCLRFFLLQSLFSSASHKKSSSKSSLLFLASSILLLCTIYFLFSFAPYVKADEEIIDRAEFHLLFFACHTTC